MGAVGTVLTPEKKKRGRPAKKRDELAAPEVITPEQEAAFAEILADVEKECPYPKDADGNYGLAATGWIQDEFNKRKRVVSKSVAIIKAGNDAEFDATFVKEAKKSDGRIDKALVRGSESFFEAVKELIDSGDKGYYKALGFKSFNAYRESKSQYSRSHIGQGIQAYKALHGRIADDKLMTIPIPTAVLLTKLPESRLTDEVIEAAATMKIQDFKEKEFPKHFSQLVDKDGNPQPIVPEDFAWIPRMRVHTQVADIWKKFMEIARWKATGLVDENDVYGSFTLDEKALLVVYMECASASGWQAEYDAAKFPEAKPDLTTEAEEPAF